MAFKPPDPPTMESTLPANPTPGADGMVTVGHLHVEAGVYGKFREAMLYDAKNPDTTTMVKSLIDGPKDTSVKEIAAKDAYTTPQANGNAEVSWNPNLMYVDGRGGCHSAAVILGHELDHANQYTHNPAQFTRDSNTPAGNYDDKEEQRVIDGWEKKTSLAVGEDVRHEHNLGQLTGSRGVTALMPMLHQTRNGNTSVVQNGYDQSGKIVSITGNTVVQDIGRGQTVSYPRDELAAIAQPGTLRVGEDLHVAAHTGQIQAQEIPSHSPAHAMGNAR
jgi:hypothetical protein